MAHKKTQLFFRLSDYFFLDSRQLLLLIEMDLSQFAFLETTKQLQSELSKHQSTCV